MKLTAAILFLLLSSLPAYACCTGGSESNQTVCNQSGEYYYADNPASGENRSSAIMSEELSGCMSIDVYVIVCYNSSESCSCNGFCFCGCCPSTVSYSSSSRQLVQYSYMNFAPFSTGIFSSSLRPVIIPPEC